MSWFRGKFSCDPATHIFNKLALEQLKENFDDLVEKLSGLGVFYLPAIKENVRLDSFQKLPWTNLNNSLITPLSLAEAGFSNLGYNNFVVCCFCDGILGNWDESDLTAWQLHAGWHPQCPFVKKHQPVEFISRSRKIVDQKHPDLFQKFSPFPQGFEGEYSLIKYIRA